MSTLDPKTFADRVRKLYSSWENDPALWNEADCLIFVNGQTDEEILYKRTVALLTWLFSKEVEDIALIITKNDIHAIVSSSSSQVASLRTLSNVDGEHVPFHLNEASDAESRKDAFDKAIELIKSGSAAKVGRIVRDTPLGEFAESWSGLFSDSFDDDVSTNVSAAVATLFAIKDASEQKSIKTAAAITSVVYRKHLLAAIENVIDVGGNMSHSALAEKAEDVFANPSQISDKLSADAVESCYTPIIQSGGVYDLRPSAVSNEDTLHFGTIVISLGARFKSYCSNVARTIFVNPLDDQERNYNFVLEIQKTALKLIRPGVQLSAVVKGVQSFVKEKRPDLVEHLLPSIGFGMGIEFREGAYSLSMKCKKTAERGMVFNLAIGLLNLKLETPSADDAKRNVYSILVADTILVNEDAAPSVLSQSVLKDYDEVSYAIDESESEEEVEEIGRSTRGRAAKQAEEVAKQREKEARRKAHQEELARKKREEAQRLLASNKSPTMEREPIAYSGADEFPPEVVSNTHKIYVDPEKQAVLLPIDGRLVPFHIRVIKSVSKQDDYLRINFNTTSSFADEQAIFIKEVTYRSSSLRDLNNSFRMIKELRKAAAARQKDAVNPLFRQEDLILSKSKVPRLTELMIRPTLGGRRTTGSLEAHKNGLRFRSNKGPTLAIIYRNIKHAFFQPAERELIVLIHFHLHQFIMVGKKKTRDVQVYAEVMEATHTLDRRRGAMFDRDEHDSERREEQLRLRLNAEFQNFVKKVESRVPTLEFDIPYRELGFSGVPHRTSVLLQPTVNCLVALIEQPFFVLTLADIELAHFERVQFNLRNFDLVFVYKDLNKTPATINAIPVEHLETIKEWLDQYDIQFYAGPTNLNWNRILSAIREDPKAFWDEGGWSFLDMDGSSEDGDEDGEEDEEEQEFVPSEDDDDDEYDLSADSESDEDSVDESDEDDAVDWDDLEAEAKEADRNTKFDKHVDSRRRKRNDQYSDDENSESEEEAKRNKKRRTSRR